ncbi:MAG: amidohydrolase [Synergistaceae bacterium]|nr:amidohydrolase [Synergistaceae bacterium]
MEQEWDSGLSLKIKSPDFIQWLEETYKDIHRHPELGMQEFRTTALVKSVMSELGVRQAEIPGMETGAVGLVEGRMPGPVLALRADMDALPIQEEADVPYRSEIPNVMHACGHDLNTTVLLGVMKYLMENRFVERMKGTLKFIFQPAEETLGGAKRMVEAGVLKNPDVDMILMSHGDPELRVGEMALFRGYSHASSDSFFIELRGKGGHGSRPFQTQDLLVAGAELINILQTIVSRDLDARDAAVLSVCTFNAGTAPNILPGSALLSGTVRTMAGEVQDKIRRRMQEVCDGIASLFHLTAKLDYKVGVPSCAVDDKAEEVLKKAGERILPQKNIRLSKSRMGGEDFAYFSQRVPAGVMRLGVGAPDGTKWGSTHSPTFRVDLRGLPVGVSILAQAAENVLAPEPEPDATKVV